MVVNEGSDFLGIFAGAAVTVGHAYTDTQSPWPFRQQVRLLERIKGIGEIIRSGNPEHGHAGIRQVDGWVPAPEPLSGFLGRHLRKGIEPRGVVPEKAASIHGHSQFETRVNPGGNTGKIAPPGNPGYPDSLAIHFRE